MLSLKLFASDRVHPGDRRPLAINRDERVAPFTPLRNSAQNDEFDRLSQTNWGWYVDTRRLLTQTMFRTGTLDLTAAQVSSKAWLFVRNSQEDAVTLRPRRRPRKPRRPGAHRCLTVDGIERPVTTLCSGV